MVVVVAPEAVPAAPGRTPEAIVVGEVVPVEQLGGRYAEAGSGRLAGGGPVGLR
jgi:hypothetical protein